MKRRRASAGAWAGTEFWGCSTYPRCRGTINIGALARESEAPLVRSDTRVGAYAQYRFERERSEREFRIPSALMPIAALSVVGMTSVFLAFLAWGLAVASSAAGLLGILVIGVIGQALVEPISWGRGAAGERRTAGYLDPLRQRGFVVLNNRRPPGVKADIDHLVTGPTGLFVIETKNWSRRADARFGRLSVAGWDRTAAIEQVKRNATAVQLVLAGGLGVHRLAVTPALCLIGGRGLFSQKRIAGVLLSNGKDLVRFVLDQPVVLGEDQVQELARRADRQLNPAYTGA